MLSRPLSLVRRSAQLVRSAAPLVRVAAPSSTQLLVRKFAANIHNESIKPATNLGMEINKEKLVTTKESPVKQNNLLEDMDAVRTITMKDLTGDNSSKLITSIKSNVKNASDLGKIIHVVKLGRRPEVARMLQLALIRRLGSDFLSQRITNCKDFNNFCHHSYTFDANDSQHSILDLGAAVLNEMSAQNVRKIIDNTKPAPYFISPRHVEIITQKLCSESPTVMRNRY